MASNRELVWLEEASGPGLTEAEGRAEGGGVFGQGAVHPPLDFAEGFQGGRVVVAPEADD